MELFKFKQMIFLTFLLVASNSASADSIVYYTTFEENNGEKCIGIHVGDQLSYQTYSGWQSLYENGTYIRSNNSIPRLTHIEITEIFNESDGQRKYSYNRTDDHPNWNEGTYKRLSTMELLWNVVETYFVYLDWNAWENMYNNITQEDIGRKARHGGNEYIYYAIDRSNETFSWTYLALIGDPGIYSSGSYGYNISDGSLVSKYRSQTYTYPDGDSLSKGRTSYISWEDTKLISKIKVSEEINCLDPKISVTSESNESPWLNYISLLILVPLVKLNKNRKY